MAKSVNFKKEPMADRIIIDCWDWHYRIAFDKNLEHSITSSSLLLDSKERKSLLDVVAVFSSMVSLSALCDAICETPERANEFLDAIDAQLLLHAPEPIAALLERKIKELQKISPSVTSTLLDLLSIAKAKSFRSWHSDIFEPVFGQEEYQTLLTRRQFIPPSNLKDEGIAPVELTNSVKQLLNQLTDPAHIDSVIGRVAAPSFEISIENGSGFAEYWPTSLSKAPRNRLVVFNNVEQLRLNILKTTLAHEVLGHGIFYEVEQCTAPPYMDHGAMCLVEGWATWCEWHASATTAGLYSRASRLYGLRWLDQTDSNEICQGIVEDTLKLGYAREAADWALLYFFQYPGFSASYTLGALWFENRFKDILPADFLQTLQSRAWGDFFQSW